MATELLTVEEFAEKLKIGRSTVFEWVNKAILTPDKHFFKIGRVLRFVWTDDVLSTLMEATVQPKQSVKRKTSTSTKSALNWDY